MKAVAFQTLDVLLSVAILAMVVHLLLIMYFAGYSLSLSIMTLKAQHVGPPMILLMGLIFLRVLLRRCTNLPKRRSSALPTMLFCVLMMLYLANGVTKGSGDTLPARYLPLSILREGNFDLNEFQFLYAQGVPYFLRHVDGRYVSDYPVGAAIAALPFYLVPTLGAVAPTDRLIGDLEKLAASSLVALSACILYLALRRLTSRRVALTLTVIYGLGTSSLSVSSQALWQHGPSQLALATGLYGLIRGRDEPGWVSLAGISLAFAVICRPTDLLLVLPLGAYVLLYFRPQIGLFVLGGLPPGLFLLWYNYTYFNDPFFRQYSGALWSTPLMEGLSGILLSPGRGLFVYSPILLGSFLGMALAWRSRGDPLIRAISVGILPTLLLYGKWISWWGGGSYGPRLLADLIPFLTICLVPCAVRLEAVHQRRRMLRGGGWLFVVLALWSIWAHALGAFGDDGRWNAGPPIDLSPHRLWSLGSSPLVEYGKDVLGRMWIAVRGMPTSRSAPEFLAVVYHLDPSSVNVMASSSTVQCPVRLCLTVVNTGQTVWLSTLGNRKGAIKLAWRWAKEGEQVSGLSGAEPLRHDVFPGDTYEFQLPFLPIPSEPGAYRLELEMASDYFGGFPGGRSKLVAISITVPTWTAEVLGSYLRHPILASADAPQLTFRLDRASYRPGEELRMIYQLAGAQTPVLINAYIAVQQPDGEVTLAAVSGQGLIKPTGRFQAGDSIHINQRLRFSGVLKFPLREDLPIGDYTVYLFSTVAGNYQMLTKATAHFLLEP